MNSLSSILTAPFNWNGLGDFENRRELTSMKKSKRLPDHSLSSLTFLYVHSSSPRYSR